MSEPQNLLLHCCCAPCTISCADRISDESINFELFWYNPNIHPFTEYKSRKEALIKYSEAKNLSLNINDEYDPKLFINSVFNVMENDDGCRCEICYKMRLDKTAEFARERGFDAFSTSLLISPYQNHKIIIKVCEEAAKKYGVNFFYRDFRPLFRQSQNKARSLEFYMQKYCGCIFSDAENGAKNKTQRQMGKK